ncbi:MAG: ABC transporter substrate-binding protein [Chloroflexi bacterium]|nr:ABC transporter substrate-binding protein [Chloroflexota bacterium]MBI2979250.1 ABC transporter substrate-binding protein [Chloroflexota bacterium]
MQRRIVWLIVSCVVVLSLILASCAPAAPTTPTAPTAPTTPTAPTAPTTPTTPSAPAAPTTEVPKYGGQLNLVEQDPIQGFAPVIFETTGPRTVILANGVLWGADWTKGMAGSGEARWPAAIRSLALSTMKLAESYELVGNDTFIFRIRKGIHFALNPASEASRLVNGRELTASDVAYSLNAWFHDPESVLQSRYTPEQRQVSFEVVDKYTVKAKTKPEVLDTVFYWTGESSSIFPPEVYEKYNKMRDWQNSVGMGAYILTDVVVGSSATLVRNPNYWERDPIGPGKGQQLPYLDRVKFVIIADSSTRQAGFRTGKIDILAGAGRNSAINAEDAKQMLKTRPEVSYFSYVTSGPTAIRLRVDKPELPAYNIKVRQALTMAIDYNTIIKDYFKGEAELAYPVVPWPEWLPMYTPMAQQNEVVRDMYTYQPEKAKKLLAEAGYPNGFKISVITQTAQVDDLSVIKFYWEKIGVNLEIDVRERAVFTSITAGKQHKEAVGETLGTTNPLNIEKWQPGTSSNVNMIDAPYVNEVLSTVQAGFLFHEREVWPVMKDFFSYAAEQAWNIQFPAPIIYHLWQPWVKNYHGEHYSGSRGPWLFAATYSWIDQALKKSKGF